jgi:UDP-N-acetylmuramoyl-tripeptide--D-alanyl-D-alanine ligase
MDNLYILAASAAVIWYVRNTIFWVYLWQRKEYRLDRLLIHLFETAQGRGLLFSPIGLLKWIGIAFYIETVFNESTLAPFHLFVTGIFLLDAVLVGKELLAGQLKRPTFSKKAFSLISLSVFFMLIILAVPLVDKFFWLLFLDKLLFFIVGFYVFIHSFPTELHRDILVNRAIQKMRGRSDMKVVGVAGSYGKSSTTDFIAQVLGRNFSVVKTRRNQHTLSGIADVILKDVADKTQVFVVEMGAYGKGEIATMCYVVKPSIGIVTGINDQHMSLFRSMDGNIASKNELVHALPEKGLALFNTNDKQVREMYKKAKVLKVAYGMNAIVGNGIYATNIKADKTSVTFKIHIKNESYALKAPLLGEHNIVNLLPAIYIADYFGMTQKEIRQRIAHLSPLPNTMILKKTINGVALVDDTFNSNPESIAAMVTYMKLYKKKRYFVLQPMIELGRNAKDQHYKVGKALANSCNAVFLTNKNYLSQIRKGIREEKGTCKIVTGSTNVLVNYLAKEVKKGDVVLCEGREAKGVLDRLLLGTTN